MATQKDSQSSHFYEELNLLRGITIFFIVFSHMYIRLYHNGIPWLSSWNHIYNLFGGAFLWGGSWFFVFISGFLFHAVFYQRGFIYKNFMVSKIQKVFSPYIFFASIFLLLKFFIESPTHINSNYIISSYFYTSFWYVPFIMCIFLMSPAFEIYITLPARIQIFIIMFSLLISIGVGRHLLNPILSCVYFLPAYLIGILSSIYYQKIITINLQLRWTIFFVSLMCLTCFDAAGYVYEPFYAGAWELHFFERPSLIIIIKLAFCFFFIWVLRYIIKTKSIILKPIDLLAKYSFTIFFFQQFPLFYLEKFPHKDFFMSISFWPRLMLIFFGSLSLCFLIILVFSPFKKILGRHSRMILGC